MRANRGQASLLQSCVVRDIYERRPSVGARLARDNDYPDAAIPGALHNPVAAAAGCDRPVRPQRSQGPRRSCGPIAAFGSGYGINPAGTARR
ncbi:hypothetical protein EMIT048CA2_230014 [Pseudomonas chlororaphis]